MARDVVADPLADVPEQCREIVRWSVVLVSTWLDQEKLLEEKPESGGSVGLAMTQRTAWDNLLREVQESGLLARLYAGSSGETRG